MYKLKLNIIVILFTFISLFTHNSLYASTNTTLDNIIIANTNHELIIHLNVKGAFTSKIQKIIHSGIPVTFSFIITLKKVKNWWFNKTLNKITITNTIKYNNLKNEYLITRPWDNNQPVIVKSIEKAQKLMSEIKNIDIAHLNKLKKGQKYQVLSKAMLNKLTLPFKLHYIFFFVSLWDFETDWHTIDFIY